MQHVARQADVGAVDRVVERGKVAGHYGPKPAAPLRLLSSQHGNAGRPRNVLTRVQFDFYLRSDRFFGLCHDRIQIVGGRKATAQVRHHDAEGLLFDFVLWRRSDG